MSELLPTEEKLDPALVKLFGRDAARFHQLLATEQRVEGLQASLKECLIMLEQLADQKNEDGSWLLCSYYIDPFGAINDARRSMGLEPIDWKSRRVS